MFNTLVDFLKFKKRRHNLGFFCYLFVNLLFTLSCSETIQQYSVELPQANPDRVMYDVPAPLAQPSNTQGGLSFYEKPELSEEQKDIRTRENSLVPIDYQNGSAGNISIKTEYEESLDILSLNFRSGGYFIYDEGLVVLWREDAPRVPHAILLSSSYQGSMDFGPWMEESQRHRKLGQSFADQFSLGVKDIQKDEKAIFFITSLYKHLENTDEDCLEIKKCHLSINPQGNYIVFELPKMGFLFGNNERRKLVQIGIMNNDKSGCFGQPFDLLKTQFFCNVSESGVQQIVSLGDDYKEAVQKSGIMSSLPINYTSNLFIQLTETTVIGWKRSDFEEKPKNIPENSPLSYVSMGNDYTTPFLLDHSLIKINLKSDNTVHLIKDPVDPEKTIMEGIGEKLGALQSQKGSFYLSTSMPQIKGNYILQKNLIKALLNLLEENYRSFYSDGNEKFKIYKRIYGEYNDKHALKASGILIMASQMKNSSLVFNVDIDEPSGNLGMSVGLINDDFGKFVINNQKTVNFNQTVKELNGFTLGDKIYLRNKKIGEATAIVSYITKNNQILTTLTDYSYEAEMAVVYESGRDRNISFQKAESISESAMNFIINPTFSTKEINGKIYEEYEINGISVSGFSFFEKINNLCSIEGFQLEMGMYDRSFTQTLIQKVKQTASDTSIQISTDRDNSKIEKTKTHGQKNSPNCFYISPQDHLFSSLKRVYFFPDHKLVLSFANRELFSLRIYKKPSEDKNKVGL